MGYEVGAIIGIIVAVIVVAILIVYLLIRCCVCCCQCMFGSSRRGADYGLHAPASSGTTYVVINQNQQPVPVIQQIPRV